VVTRDQLRLVPVKGQPATPPENSLARIGQPKKIPNTRGIGQQHQMKSSHSITLEEAQLLEIVRDGMSRTRRSPLALRNPELVVADDPARGAPGNGQSCEAAALALRMLLLVQG